MIIDKQVEQYCMAHTSPECALLAELLQNTRVNMPGSQMLSDRLVSQLLKILVTVSGARRILEIGTYTGYSALMMAQALPEDGELVTLEKSTEAFAYAKTYFARSDHSDKINPVLCDAMDELKRRFDQHEQFDFIFLDADKKRYPDYFVKLIDLLKSGGLLVIDNALWGGSVLQPDDDSARAIDHLNQIIIQDKRLENVLLPVRDGVNVVRRI